VLEKSTRPRLVRVLHLLTVPVLQQIATMSM
jgi:hypothetical protein